MRCVITGVAGFVGSSLAERLAAEGHEIIGIDCFHDYYDRAQKESNIRTLRDSRRFRFVEADLVSADLVPLIEGAEWIFHQAGQPGVRKSWGSYFQTYVSHNVLATQRMLEASKGSSSLKRFVYASSSSVYGDAETLPTSEAVTPRPVSPYGVTKLAAEHLAVLYASQFGLPTVSLRYFTVFGPRQRPDMSFHRIARSVLSGDEFVLFGDGEQSRDFTYIDDIVGANILAAERAPTAGAVYNIGGGNRVTMNDVLRFVDTELGRLRVKRIERQEGDARHTGADISRAQREIGYAPRIGWQEGISAEFAWLKAALGA